MDADDIVEKIVQSQNFADVNNTEGRLETTERLNSKVQTVFTALFGSFQTATCVCSSAEMGPRRSAASDLGTGG